VSRQFGAFSHFFELVFFFWDRKSTKVSLVKMFYNLSVPEKEQWGESHQKPNLAMFMTRLFVSLQLSL